MKRALALWLWIGVACAAEPALHDYAYRARIQTAALAPAYRFAVPLSVYQKAVRTDLGDLRVFNGGGELVPFDFDHPATRTVSGEARALPIFPLKDTSIATLDAVRITIETGRKAVNVRTRAAEGLPGTAPAYIVDGRSFDVPVTALVLEWPDDAADFAGRLQVEASDSLNAWHTVNAGAPIANLSANGQRLVERRVDFAPTRARFWRLSWVGVSAPFALSSLVAEEGNHSAEQERASLEVTGKPSGKPGEVEFDLGANVPADRVNLELPQPNTVVDIELLSRSGRADPWRSVHRGGFYRLNGNGHELRNGAVSIGQDRDRYWLIRADTRGGGMGAGRLVLTVQWVPQVITFIARGKAPFYLAYGNADALPAQVSLADLPRTTQVETATLAEPETAGGENRLKPAPPPFPWRNSLLWSLLIAGAGFLAWMALRLFRDVSK